MDKGLYDALMTIAVVVMAIGGLNWGYTAIMSWMNESEELNLDLLQGTLGLPPDFANVVYMLAAVCSLVVAGVVLTAMYSKPKAMM